MKKYVVIKKIGSFSPSIVGCFDEEQDANEFARLSNISDGFEYSVYGMLLHIEGVE